ncbi:MAG: flagellin lysine-N-methylase [Heliobacteriaceae bacterium]|nr:flagellin lysine-N-methylase [Heliobacteriaceae bacterium]
MSKSRPLLVPQYLRQFKCIGPQCEDTCCIGWRVNIDHPTYRQYRRLKHPELKPDLDKYIKRNRSTPSEDHYAKVKLNPDSRCPFLTEKSLCRIQLTLGEDYLSDVCATYPRTANEINDVLEKSATMSCPEAARLALLNPAIMEFDEIEEPATVRNIVSGKIDTHQLAVARKPQRYFWELRIFTIGLLQNRQYRLPERLIILGLFHQRLQELIEHRQPEKIPELIAKYANLTGTDELQSQLAQIPVQVAIQMELLKELADERIFKGVNSRRYLACFAEFLTGIQYTKEALVEDIADRYQKAETEHYLPFMGEHEYILENYLVNYVFKNLYPFTGNKDLFDNYVMLVIHYALIKLHLIGMAAFHQGLTEDLVIKLIQSFAKTVEHNQQYLQHVFDLLKNNGYTTMAYMAILIKN